MALNIARRRRAASGVPHLPVGPGVTPSATPDAFWRASVGWSITPAGTGGPVTPPAWAAVPPPLGPAWAADVSSPGWLAGV